MRLLPSQRASPIFSCSLMTRVGKLEFESSHPLQSFSEKDLCISKQQTRG